MGGMADEEMEPEKRAAVAAPEPCASGYWTGRCVHVASGGTAVAVGLALLLTWHVINGKHGLQVWHQKRAEDQQLRKEIQRTSAGERAVARPHREAEVGSGRD
jgi:hypothetical protein